MNTKKIFIALTVILLTVISTSVYSQSIILKIGPNNLHKFEVVNRVSPFNVFFKINQPTGMVTINNNIELENTSFTGNKGVIFKGGDRFISGTFYNTFVGKNSGYHLYDGGSANTGIGSYSLSKNGEGNDNTAVGFKSLEENYLGNGNTAIGYSSLAYNVDGHSNSALGWKSLHFNVSGRRNTAIGLQSLYNNIGNEFLMTGFENTGVGYWSLYNNTSGNKNTAIGTNAGTGITTGNNNTAIGFDAQVPNGTANDQVQIGNSNVTYAGVKVAWTITSDRNLKSNISNSSLGLNFVNSLRPVSYTRKNDVNQKTEFGFIAQEVEEVLNRLGVGNSGMITKSDDGIYGVRYNDIIAPIVKAVQELKSENDNLKKEIENLNNVIDKFSELERTVNGLKSFIQMSSDNAIQNISNSK